MVRSTVAGALAYSFPSVACSPADLAALDSICTSVVKHKFGLMRCAPTALVMAPHELNGLDCPSLAVEYHTRNAQALRAALDDGGGQSKLAVFSKATLLEQALQAMQSPISALRTILADSS